MLAERNRECGRRILDGGRYRGILPGRCGLLWRTHDFGLLSVDAGRLDDQLRGRIEKLLGAERAPVKERAAIPVKLFYALAAGHLALREDPEEPGGLPGAGVLLRSGGDTICLAADPEACLAELSRIEERAREELLARVLGAAPQGIPTGDTGESSAVSAGAPPIGVHPGEDSACGRCSSGLLGGSCDCLGPSCVNNRGT